MKNNVLAVDLGFGSTKVAYMLDSGQMNYSKYVSAVAKIQSKDFISDGNAFSFDNENYYLFEDALKLPSGSTMDLMSYEGLRMASPVILRKVMMDLGVNRPDMLVLGLSISMINYSADYRQYVAKALNLDPENIKLVPQGIGAKVAYDNYGLDPYNAQKSAISKNYLGVDIGFNTVDIFQVINGQSSSNAIAGLANKGVSVAAQELMTKLANECTLDIQDCKSILVEGKQTLRGNVIDRQEVIAKILQNYIIGVIQQVEQQFASSINKMDNIIFFGGGAALMKKYNDLISETLKQHYPEGFLQIVEAPEYYNVAGYYVIGINSLKS